MSILFFLHNLEIKYDLQSNSPCCRFLWVLLSHRRDHNFILAEWSKGESVRGADMIQGALYGISLKRLKNTTLVRWLNFVESTIYQMVWLKFVFHALWMKFKLWATQHLSVIFGLMSLAACWSCLFFWWAHTRWSAVHQSFLLKHTLSRSDWQKKIFWSEAESRARGGDMKNGLKKPRKTLRSVRDLSEVLSFICLLPWQ